MSLTLSQDELVFVSLSPYCLGEMSKKTKVLGGFKLVYTRLKCIFGLADTYELLPDNLHI